MTASAAEEKGLSQEAFAEEVEISVIECGIRNPTVLIIEKVAKALKVSASTLIE